MEVEYRGWMTKEGGSYKSWKRRYFVLQHQELRYYKKESDAGSAQKKPVGIIPIAGCNVLRLSKGERPDKKFGFKIESHIENNRVYYFNTESVHESADWMTMLQKASGVNHDMLDMQKKASVRDKSLAGWLSKRGGRDGKKAFKRRYVYMDGDSIRYYLQPNDPKPKGEISLLGARLVDSSEEFLEFHLQAGGEDAGRVFVFKAEDPDSFRTWMGRLQEVLQFLDQQLTRSMNFWSRRNIYLPFLVWRDALALKGLEKFDACSGTLTFFARREFQPIGVDPSTVFVDVGSGSPSSSGADEWLMKDYEAQVFLKVSTYGPSDGILMTHSRFSDADVYQALLKQHITTNHVDARVLSVEDVPVRDGDYAEADFGIWKGCCARLLTEDAELAVGLMARLYCPPHGRHQKFFVVTVQKSPRTAGAESPLSLIQDILHTIRPSKSTTIIDYDEAFIRESLVENAQEIDPELASSDFFAWADVLCDVVPPWFQRAASWTDAFHKFLFTGVFRVDADPREVIVDSQKVTPDQETICEPRISPVYLAQCLDGLVLGDRFNLEHVAKSLRKSQFQSNIEVHVHLMSVLTYCSGIQSRQGFTADLFADAFSQNTINEPFVARLLDVHLFDICFPCAYVNRSELETHQESEAEGKPDGDLAVVTSADFENQQKKDLVEVSNAELASIMGVLFSKARLPSLKLAVALELSFLISSQKGFADLFLRCQVDVPQVIQEWLGLQDASVCSSFSDPCKLQLRLAALKLAVNLSTLAPLKPGIRKSILPLISRFYLSDTGCLRADIVAARYAALIVKNSAGEDPDGVMEAFVNGATVSYAVNSIILRSFRIGVSQPTLEEEKFFQSLFDLLWRSCREKSFRRIPLAAKGFSALCARFLKEIFRTDEAKVPVMGFLLSASSEFGEKMAKSSDLIVAVADCLLKCVLPKLMFLACAVLLSLVQYSSAREKMMSLPEVLMGVKRASRFRRDKELVRFATALAKRLKIKGM
eukprot:ANDGO_01655.mRNA.1 Uncharacterized protein CG43867